MGDVGWHCWPYISCAWEILGLFFGDPVFVRLGRGHQQVDASMSMLPPCYEKRTRHMPHEGEMRNWDGYGDMERVFVSISQSQTFSPSSWDAVQAGWPDRSKIASFISRLQTWNGISWQTSLVILGLFAAQTIVNGASFPDWKFAWWAEISQKSCMFAGRIWLMLWQALLGCCFLVCVFQTSQWFVAVVRWGKANVVKPEIYSLWLLFFAASDAKIRGTASPCQHPRHKGKGIAASGVDGRSQA